MSEENQLQVVEQVQEKARGDKGEVGKATAGLTIKQRWAKEGRGLSLRGFARKLGKEDPLVKEWFEHKGGSLNKTRSDANQGMAKLCASATKLQKHKKKGEGGAK